MPDDPKLAEFREKNIALLKEIDEIKAKYSGIDPATVPTQLARLADLDKQKPFERVTALETELAAEKTAHADTRKRSDALVIDNEIGDVFLKSGGRPEARTFITTQAAGLFLVENGQIKGAKFSPDRAGEPMSVTEWVTLQTRQNPFCFFGSGGSGANPRPGGGGTGKVLRNPSPHDLGKFAKEIASGELKVVYE